MSAKCLSNFEQLQIKYRNLDDSHRRQFRGEPFSKTLIRMCSRDGEQYEELDWKPAGPRVKIGVGLDSIGYRRCPVPSRRRSPNRVPSLTLAAAFDPKSFLATTGIGKTVRHFKPNQVLFTQGELADTILYIQQGRVRLSVLSKQGKEATIALLGPGDFVGEGCIAADQPLRTTTATTVGDCSILRIQKKEILRVLHDEHKFSDLFIAYLVDRHSRTQADLVDQLFNSSEKRLARALLILARVGKKDRPEAVIPRVNQAILAEMIGTTRSRVNFFMNRFRKLGFIKYNGGLQVSSSLLSVVLHD
jgi:CRP/FNR family transcriptional regulator, cyclic AMP receptor protein